MRRRPAAPGLTIERTVLGRLRLTLTGQPDAYTLLTHVEVPDPTARFSANFFDLRPGKRREVTIEVPEGELRPEEIHLRWG